MKKLNIGSGSFPKTGFINLDFIDAPGIDVRHDLNEFPYPFKGGEVDLIEADHVLEHLNDPFRVMKELHRVLSPKGRLIIRVPHFSRGFTNSDHRRGFDVTFPLYFKPTVPAGYIGPAFNLEYMKLRWFGQPYFKKQMLTPFQYYAAASLGSIFTFLANLSPYACSRLWCYWVGGFDEIEFRFIKG